jgi:hypothetical protein
VNSEVAIPLQILWVVAVLAQATSVVLAQIRRRAPALPNRLPASPAPPVVLVKPVLAADAETVERCRAWARSAAAYPGRAAFVVTTTEATAATLAPVGEAAPSVEFHLVACSEAERRREGGLDKSHRLMAAEPVVEKILGSGEGLIIATDEDTRPVHRDSVARLASAAPHPGEAASVLYRSASTSEPPWWQQVAEINMAVNNAVYAVGSRFFDRFLAVTLGWTMVLWSSDLRAAGGFGAASGHIGDELALGIALARRGVRGCVYDAEGVVEIVERRHTLPALWEQQVRWRALLRALDPPLLVALTLMVPFGLPVILSTAVVLVHPGLGGLSLLASALLVSHWCLGVPVRRFWLIPCHEILVLSAQIAGMLTSRIGWGPWTYCIDHRSRIRGKRWRG